MFIVTEYAALKDTYKKAGTGTFARLQFLTVRKSGNKFWYQNNRFRCYNEKERWVSEIWQINSKKILKLAFSIKNLIFLKKK